MIFSTSMEHGVDAVGRGVAKLKSGVSLLHFAILCCKEILNNRHSDPNDGLQC